MVTNITEYAETIKKLKTRGNATINIVKKDIPFIAAILDTELGRQLLLEDIERFEELLYKAAEIDLNVDERAEFKVLKRRIITFSTRLNRYLNFKENTHG